MLASGLKDLFCDRRYYSVVNGTTYRKPWYNLSDFAAGWGALLRAAARTARPLAPGLRHDLVDVTREALVQYSDVLRNQLSLAVWKRDVSAARAIGAEIMELLADLDRILASDEGFLLGSWLEDAKRAAGGDPEAQALYEWNARSQVTLYLRDVGTPDYSGTMDYAAKHWSGLVGTYYTERWRLYLGMVDKAMAAGTDINCTQFVARVIGLTYSWMNSTELHANTTTGDALLLSTAAYRKYMPLLPAFGASVQVK